MMPLVKAHEQNLHPRLFFMYGPFVKDQGCPFVKGWQALLTKAFTTWQA